MTKAITGTYNTTNRNWYFEDDNQVILSGKGIWTWIKALTVLTNIADKPVRTRMTH